MRKVRKLLAVLLLIVLLAGCTASPTESTVILAECIGCYRDTLPSEIGGTKTVYVIDVIYANELFSLRTDAPNYYQALKHINGQIWLRVDFGENEALEVIK